MLRPSRRVLATVLAAVVVVTGFVLLDRWRDDDADDRFADYCGVVVEQRALIGAALEAGATTGLIRALPSFEALRAEAPDDIAEEWDQVIGAVEELVETLEEAGVDPASYRRQRPPAGLDRAEREAIDAAAARLGSPTTAAALASVEQQARDVCGSPLSL